MTARQGLQQGATVAAARRTLAAILRDAGLESPDLDARLLIGHALGLEHAALVSSSERALTASEIAQIENFGARRLAHEPVAHILGRKEFWGLDFAVSADVLVPRPETETLVEAALELFDSRKMQPLRIADLGTGSGALLVALLHEFPNATGVGTDVSEKALDIARANAWKHGFNKRAEFMLSDFGAALAGGYDLVVSNPPYIPTGDIAGLVEDVRDYDPLLALDGGADGLAAYRAIAADCRRLVSRGGALILEVGIGQAVAVNALLADGGMAVRLPPRPDLAGIPRAITAISVYVSG